MHAKKQPFVLWKNDAHALLVHCQLAPRRAVANRGTIVLATVTEALRTHTNEDSL